MRLEVACVRPSLLLGPGDWRLASCRSVLDLIEGKVPFVPPGGISFVDARDAAEGARSLFSTSETVSTASATLPALLVALRRVPPYAQLLVPAKQI